MAWLDLGEGTWVDTAEVAGLIELAAVAGAPRSGVIFKSGVQVTVKDTTALLSNRIGIHKVKAEG